MDCIALGVIGEISKYYFDTEQEIIGKSGWADWLFFKGTWIEWLQQWGKKDKLSLTLIKWGMEGILLKWEAEGLNTKKGCMQVAAGMKWTVLKRERKRQ